MSQLLSPADLKRRYPLSDAAHSFIARARSAAADILENKDPRLAVIVGPCSIHNCDAALEYAHRLKRLLPVIEDSLLVVMRVFCEKPRTKAGWKGLVYDPSLDGSHNVEEGLSKTRQLFTQLADLGIASATEFLEPLAAPYYEDLVTWGFIGARTSASQPHRQLASTFSFPVGFKNTIFGDLDPAYNGILSAKMAHTYLGLCEEGRAAVKKSSGNPLGHLVLRGSESRPNYDLASVEQAQLALKHHGIATRMLIDCSHGNSGKDHRRQRIAFDAVLQLAKKGMVAGLMIESHLVAGKQPHGEEPQQLRYGVSITDSCIGWEETEELLLSAAALGSFSPTSMSSVQN